jgi:hypothetical protein
MDNIGTKEHEGWKISRLKIVNAFPGTRYPILLKEIYERDLLGKMKITVLVTKYFACCVRQSTLPPLLQPAIFSSPKPDESTSQCPCTTY